MRPSVVFANGPASETGRLQAGLRGPWRQAARAVMVLLSLHGLTPEQIAVLLECHPATVRRWIGRFNDEGLAGLADRPRCGRPRLGGRRLTRRIAALLARPGPWTLPRIRRYLGRPQVSMRTLYRRVRLAAVWRRPKLTARGDPWHDHAVAGIVARLIALPRRAVVLAEDETHLNLLPHVRASWTLRAARPEVPTPGKNRQVTVFGALEVSSGRWVYRLGRRCAADFTALLEQVLRAFPCAPVIVVICDNDSIHHARKVNAWLDGHPRLELLYGARYSPHDNPVERIWAALKNYVANTAVSWPGRLRQIHSFFRARSPDQMLDTAAPWTSPWLPPRYEQDFGMTLSMFLRGRRAENVDIKAQNITKIDAWAEAEITEDKLQPLMEGEIVTSHPGTPDGQWQCAYEFTANGYDRKVHKYRLVLLPQESLGIFDADEPVTARTAYNSLHIAGDPSKSSSDPNSLPVSFDLFNLLPRGGQSSLYGFDFGPWGSGERTESSRRFAGMAKLSPDNGDRTVSLATVLRIILQSALMRTSDTRLLPSGSFDWSASDPTLNHGVESQVPNLLARLKNGDPAERARYKRIRELFKEFTQGRDCEVRLIEARQLAQDGQDGNVVQMPAIWVTVNASDGSAALDPEVPIEFAGAGAWEALVLASALGEPAASVVILDEPAVALHPSLQRQLGAYLLSSTAQFLVITHSAELLPLADAADVRLVRLDRDDKSATMAWPVDEACRLKMSRKLVAKGNERLPFAWRAILCEGQDDVEAIMALAERMAIDLRRRNIAVADCGSRDNSPDYIWFCTELGLKYLAVMDADVSKLDALPHAQLVREAVSLRHGGELAEFPENLETTFGVIKKKPSLVPRAIRRLSFIGNTPDPAQAPPEVVALTAAIHRLIK